MDDILEDNCKHELSILIKEEIIPLSNKKAFNNAWDKLGSIKRIYIKV